MSPTRRAAILIAIASAGALYVQPPLAAILVVAVVTLTVIDALHVRTTPAVRRAVAHTQSRGIRAPLRIEVQPARASRVHCRQPVPADVDITPSEGHVSIDATLVPRRRGRHRLEPVAVRAVGPLGMGAWTHGACGEASELLVYPDLPAARRLAAAVRQGRFRAPGRLTRGPLGLGTDFESIRDYLPDDDIRQVNWRATARAGRPMSNTYRVEQDRDVLCVVDTGRLMQAPLEDRSRLDAAIDAACAVAFVADELGDRCGTLAFDNGIRRHLRPRRSGGDGVVQALFDLEPTGVDSDYELAFRVVGEAKRAFVVVFTDLLEESAARPLVDAIAYLARRHAVAVATASDTDLENAIRSAPASPGDVYAASVAVEVLDARAQVTRSIEAAGAAVIDVPPSLLGAACVGAYLRAKARVRV